MPDSIATRIHELQAAGEDWEWYPTTDEIIRAVANDLVLWDDQRHGRDNPSIMDIGAGDGRVLKRIKQIVREGCKEHWHGLHFDALYAIEKSQTHLLNMPKDIIVVGCDFHEQMLMDKRVNILFCNPPYSEYEQWTKRILTETNVERIYLVIPRRWRDSAELTAIVDELDADVKSLGEFDFENADRQARAKVEIVCFQVKRGENDAFNAAIEKMLPELDEFDRAPPVRKKHSEEELNELCVGGDIVSTLVTAYDAEIEAMCDAYRDIVKMNVKLLKELGVTKDSILNGLRSKIVALKDKYWKVLFDHLDVITKKLATKQRKQFLESLTDKAVIDFTESNIYAMLIWVSKCASEHFDDQLVELFKALAQKATVERYKSNQKVFQDGNWRYLNEHETHYRLCYRMVLETHGGIYTGEYGQWENPNGLCKSSHELLGDWITVANNLGFPCSASTFDHEWKSNKKVEFYLDDGELLMDVRAFKNGNLHIRPHKKVMLAINVQAGKLLGWLRTEDEAIEELNAQDEAEFVRDMFNRTNQLTFSNILQLTHA